MAPICFWAVRRVRRDRIFRRDQRSLGRVRQTRPCGTHRGRRGWSSWRTRGGRWKCIPPCETGFVLVHLVGRADVRPCVAGVCVDGAATWWRDDFGGVHVPAFYLGGCVAAGRVRSGTRVGSLRGRRVGGLLMQDRACRTQRPFETELVRLRAAVGWPGQVGLRNSLCVSRLMNASGIASR